GAAAGRRKGNLGIDSARDPGSGIAEALTTVFTPAARALRDIVIRQFFFAPFGGPARFAASSRLPLALEVRLPGPPALVPEPHPREVKKFVKQYPAMLPRALFEAGI